MNRPSQALNAPWLPSKKPRMNARPLTRNSRISKTVPYFFAQNYIENFQEFQSVMDNFTLKLAEGLQNSGLVGPMHKGGSGAEKIYQPSISDIESVAESLITKTNIVILTGAGISVASGIPTFRGKGGLWTTKNS